MASPGALEPSRSSLPPIRIRSSPARFGTSHQVFSVNESGVGRLAGTPVPSAMTAEQAVAPSDETATDAAARATAATAELLSPEQLQELVKDEGTEELKRVVQHALALETLHDLKRADYLLQLESAKAKIARLESELAILPAFYDSSSHLEIARLRGDNDQITRQAVALARKLQSVAGGEGAGGSIGSGTRMDGGDPGLKRENRILLADVRHLERRLALSETEACRLASELRRLRPYYLQGSPLIVHDAQIVLPPEEANKPGSRAVLLGDAEAELLIQAGRKQSHIRRIQRIPLDKAILDQAEDIVQAIVPLPVDPATSTSHPHPPSQLHARRRSSIPLDLENTLNTPQNYHLPVPPSIRNPKAQDGPASICSPANDEKGDIEDEQPALPSVPPLRGTADSLLSNSVTTQSGNGGGTVNAVSSNPKASTSSSPLLEHTTGDGNSRRSPRLDDDSTSHSASFSLPTVAPVSTTTPLSHSPLLFGPSIPRRESSTSDASNHPELAERGNSGIVGSAGKPFGRTPSALDLLSEAAGAVGTSKDDTSTSYNPRSRKPKLDANGEKKARSPYIKWNIEEDEQLLKAVIQCGCAWDSVAKLCPTRAYHQVRQRFLRGLRSGETLPPELMHLQAAVRRSVAEYESRRKRKRPLRQLSTESQDHHDPLLAHYHAGQNLEDEHMIEDDAGDPMYDG